jgi:hypothetical protein
MGDTAFHVRMLADQQNRYAASSRPRQADDVAQDVEHLRLVVAALWSLLAERGGPSLDDLIDRMDELDHRDGAADGRYTAPPRPCPACQAMVPADRAACQFCGEAVPGADPFA